MQRLNDSLTGAAERRLLVWLCARLPRSVTSDMLTLAGVAGAALALAGYALAPRSNLFLWLACAGIALNWFGDSLDGTLARQLKAERPRYGFFIDHMSDSFAMALIAIGIGLSPYASMMCAMTVLMAYYLMVILSMVTNHATGVLQISYNGVGPTEIRLVIFICTVTATLLPTPSAQVGGLVLTIYDAMLLAVSLALVLTCLSQAFKTARKLAVEDPPRR